VPQPLTYPGVYVEEVPSGVRPIAGVATSITAFVGRTRKGDPSDRPLALLTSYADFVEQFGGLWPKSRLGQAVQDFYLNGGRQAVICRVYAPPAGGDGRARIAFGADAKAVTVVAASPGEWGNGLRVRVDHRGAPADSDVFNLEVREKEGRTERFAGVSLYEDRTRNVRDVLARESSLARWDAPLQPAPAAGGTRVRPDDGATDAASTQEAAAGTAAKDVKAKVRAAVAAAAAKEAAQAAAAAATAKVTAAEATLADAEAKLAEAQALPDDDATKAQKVSDATATRDAAKTARDDAKAAEATAAEKTGTANGAATTADQELATARTASDTAATAASDAAKYGGDDGGAVDLAALTAQAGPALAKVDLFNLLCIPPLAEDGADVGPDVYDWAASVCIARRAFLLVDPPSAWNTPAKAAAGFRSDADELGGRSPNSAVYFPRLQRADGDAVPCGAVAGVIARTDGTRGVWKAPAGLDATLRNVPGLTVRLSDDENGVLNPLGINCLRSMPPAGRVVWGARTLVGADSLANEWKYMPVRRLALFIEESLFRGTKWVVFEPNDEPLWAQIRLNVGSFLHGLFRQSAFQGRSPREAYFVKCDGETTTQADRDRGVVNINVGFAPLKPAEFVVIRLQQLAGQIET
jgi:phage tail sheath protein FI